MSETITENLFRNFYMPLTFIEKTAIPKQFGFQSKNKKTLYKGYPDFFREEDGFTIVVEAKATDHLSAIEEVKHYILKNKITKDIIGIAVSGQTEKDLQVDYFLKLKNSEDCKSILSNNSFLTLKNISNIYWKQKDYNPASSKTLNIVLKDFNKKFNDNKTLRETDRSLFFSGIMIALKDGTFRNTYKNIESPSESEIKSKKNTILQANNLNNAILDAITRQLKDKINSLSKEYSWRDKFSFIKNVDYTLLDYKNIIQDIEDKIFIKFQNDEKHDILGRAYKIFLSRAGKIDNRNIIITPDHIKNLMIKLARLNINDVVLDTCTGTGGFLMESMEDMIKKANGDENKINNIKEKQLIGFETDSVLFALACSNMFLHGDGRTNLLFRSSLLDYNNKNILNNKDKDLFDYIKKQKPTKCIINPPYEKNNSIKFILQALNYLDDNGKLFIIMPTPTLTQNHDDLTKKILKVAKLDFVIKMPYNLFSEQGRTVNTSIFGFTKIPHNKNDEVIYYNLEDDGFVSVQHKGRIDKNDKWSDKKAHILDCILNHKEDGEICKKRKIYKENILNCAGIEENTNKNSQMMKIDDLFNIENGTLASEKNEEGDFDFITGSENWKKHSTFEHNKEALIYVVGAGGSLGRSHYANGKFIASNLCLVLTPKNIEEYPINLQFYNTYFQHMRKKIVSDLADGTSKLTINPEAFKNYYIDYITIDKQNSFTKQYIKKHTKEILALKKKIKQTEINIKRNLEELI